MVKPNELVLMTVYKAEKSHYTFDHRPQTTSPTIAQILQCKLITNLQHIQIQIPLFFTGRFIPIGKNRRGILLYGGVYIWLQLSLSGRLQQMKVN